MLRDTQGAVFVENLISYLTVVFFCLCTLQLAQLAAASLVVQRAADAAARASAVVVPDDPAFYGSKGGDIGLATAMVLAASPQIDSDFTVAVAVPGAPSGNLTATVTANFHCGRWTSLMCGTSGIAEFEASSSMPMHGARYGYDSGTSGIGAIDVIRGLASP